MSFQEQVAAMRNTTVLIGVHGAGLTNLLFLPDHAAIVEVLPWHWDRRAYERIGQLLGYTYRAWRNDERADTQFDEKTFDMFPACSEEDRETIRNADSKPMVRVGLSEVLFQCFVQHLKGIAALAAEKYWINQHTRVDVASFVEVVSAALDTGLNGALGGSAAAKRVHHSEL